MQNITLFSVLAIAISAIPGAVSRYYLTEFCKKAIQRKDADYHKPCQQIAFSLRVSLCTVATQTPLLHIFFPGYSAIWLNMIQ